MNKTSKMLLLMLTTPKTLWTTYSSQEENNLKWESNKSKRIKRATERITMKLSSQEDKSTRISNSKLLNWMTPLLQLTMLSPSFQHFQTHPSSKSRDSKTHWRTLNPRSNPDPEWPQWSRHSSHLLQTKTSLTKESSDKSLVHWTISEMPSSTQSMPKLLPKHKQ
jgi:hypothetical protein